MRRALRNIAELSLTAGVVLAMFVLYMLWGTGRYTSQAQHGMDLELAKEWHNTAATTSAATSAASAPAPVAVRIGHPFAIIRIPEFGSGWHFAVIEGVGTAQLAKGPGHYPGTALPGQVGNMVVSGHRTTYLAPFKRIGELAAGDQIILDTATAEYVYQVTGHIIVRPDRTSVLAQVPLHPGERPTRRLLTLTTCHPEYSDAYRLVVFARLAQTLPRAS